MSTWYQADDDEIDIDESEEEFNICVFGDYGGSVYVTLTFEQIERMYHESRCKKR